MISRENTTKSNPSLEQINIFAYAENMKDNSTKQFTTDEFKFLIDSSIFGLFGVLEANKIKYFLKKEDLNSKFLIKTYEK